MLRSTALASLIGYLVASANANPEPAPAPEPLLGLNVPLVDQLLGSLGLSGCPAGQYRNQATGSCTAIPNCAVQANIVTSANAGGSANLLNINSGTCVSLKDCIGVNSLTFATVPGVLGALVPIQVGVCKKVSCGTNYLLDSSTGQCVFCDPTKNTIVNGVCKPCDLTKNTIINGVCTACDLNLNKIVNGVCVKKQTCTIGGQVLNAAGVCVCLDGTTLIPALGKCVTNPNCGSNALVKVDVNTNTLKCACKDGFGFNNDGICVSLDLLGIPVDVGVNLGSIGLKKERRAGACPQGSVPNAYGKCIPLSSIGIPVHVQAGPLAGVTAGTYNTEDGAFHVGSGDAIAGLLTAALDVSLGGSGSATAKRSTCPEGAVLSALGVCLDLGDINAAVAAHLASTLGVNLNVVTSHINLKERRSCGDGAKWNHVEKRCVIRSLPRREIARRLNRE